MGTRKLRPRGVKKVYKYAPPSDRVHGIDTANVPYGFICGFPTKRGDLYGGGLYMKSSALDTKQHDAAKAACARWGQGYEGEEVIPHPVCKRKYQPCKDGQVQYGCHFHHPIRFKRLQRHGARKGWESFYQWEHLVSGHVPKEKTQEEEKSKNDVAARKRKRTNSGE